MSYIRCVKKLIMKTSAKKLRVFLLVTLAGILLVCSSRTFAQAPDWEWAKSAGGTLGDGGRAITYGADGNLLVSGYFHESATFDTTVLTSPLYSDVFIAKYTTAGELLWAKSVASSASNGIPQAIYEDASGNIYITGTFGVYGGAGDITFDEVTTFISWGNEDIFVAKYDAEGNFIWAKHIGSDWSDKVVSTMDFSGNIILSGILWSTTYFNSTGDWLNPFHMYDIFLAKIDTTGTFTFRRNAVSCTAVLEPQDVTTDSYGNIYLTGWYNGRPTFGLPADSIDLEVDIYNHQGFIARYEPLIGMFIWAYTAGNTSYGDYSLTLNSKGGGKIVMSGLYLSSASFGNYTDTITLIAPPAAGYGELYLVQYDTNGNADWAINAGHGSGGGLNFLDAYYKDGHLYVAGDYSAGPTVFGQGTDAVTVPYLRALFVASYDDAGNLDWVNLAGSGYSAVAESVVTDALNNIYITGWYDSGCAFIGTPITIFSAGWDDILVARLDDISVSVYENELNQNQFIFPNPSSAEVTLNIGKEVKCNVQLFNLQGELLFQKTTNTAKVKLDVSNFPKGIYFITVTDEMGNKVTNKMLKM
jgi:hypothetical protein